MNRVLVATALTAGMALLGAQAARADAITQSFTFPTFPGYTNTNGSTLSGFNSALGTLTSVDVSDSVTATWTGGGVFDINVASYRIDVGPMSLDLELDKIGNGSASGSQSITATDSATLAAFVGGSQYTFVRVSNTGSSPASISSAFGTGTLTYNYTPATTSVPEPGSLALLGTALIGLGAIGFSGRRRA